MSMLLKVFLNRIIDGTKKDKKIESLGQAIVQASPPRGVRAPL